ncbi:hypothetical protein V1525DRAFT_403762, partial [Lipomyces kononenkoae]
MQTIILLLFWLSTIKVQAVRERQSLLTWRILGVTTGASELLSSITVTAVKITCYLVRWSIRKYYQFLSVVNIIS